MPPCSSQLAFHSLISSHVHVELVIPEVGIAQRPCASPATVSVPEAPVHEYSRMMATKYEVGTAGQSTVVPNVLDPHRRQQIRYTVLRTGVPRADTTHDLRSFLGSYPVHSSHLNARSRTVIQLARPEGWAACDIWLTAMVSIGPG